MKKRLSRQERVCQYLSQIECLNFVGYVHHVMRPAVATATPDGGNCRAKINVRCFASAWFWGSFQRCKCCPQGVSEALVVYADALPLVGVIRTIRHEISPGALLPPPLSIILYHSASYQFYSLLKSRAQGRRRRGCVILSGVRWAGLTCCLEVIELRTRPVRNDPANSAVAIGLFFYARCRKLIGELTPKRP